MISFFNKKSPKLISDFAHLQVDIHSHLIPSIDDGVDTVETALELIKRLQALGYKKLITTPHIMSDMYPNTRADILDGLEKVRAALDAAGIDIAIDAAAEYYMDEQFEDLIKDADLLTLPGNRVLVEMSFVSEPPNLFHYIFRMQTKGYKPILAHPERYIFLKKNFEQYHRLKEYGCEFQLNILSLTGYYGKPTQELALKLLKNKMIDYLGTDLHHERHAERLEQLFEDRRVLELISDEEAFLNHTLVN